MQLADLITCHPSEAINSSWDTEVGDRKKKKNQKKTKKPKTQSKPEQKREP